MLEPQAVCGREGEPQSETNEQEEERTHVAAPDHAAERDARLDHVRVGEDEVLLDDRAVERALERAVVDEVDAAERTTLPRDDRVAAHDGPGRAENDDAAVGRVDDRVALDGRALAGDRDAVGPLLRDVDLVVAALELLAIGGVVSTGPDGVARDEHVVARVAVALCDRERTSISVGSRRQGRARSRKEQEGRRRGKRRRGNVRSPMP